MKNQFILSLSSALGGAEIVVILFTLSLLVLPVVALINALTSDFKNSSDKVSWVIAIVFVPILGPVLYLTIGTKNRIIKDNK